MRSRGFVGRIVGLIMQWMNAPACRAAMDVRQPERGCAYLEIGFGRGPLLALHPSNSGRSQSWKSPRRFAC
jgi:hypothetical protein